MRTRKKLGLVGFIICSILAVSLLTCSKAAASTYQDLINQKNAAAAAKLKAQQLQAQKEKDAAAVKEQINSVTSKINVTEGALNSTGRQIGETQNNIADLNNKIKEEETKLAAEKAKAGQIISSWYMEGEEGLLTAVIGSDSLSEIVTKQEQYNSVQQQIEETMNRIEIYKSQLSTQKTDKDRQLITLEDLQRSQENQKKELEYQKNMKDRLYNDTQHAIADLKEEEKRANQVEQEALTEIARIAASRQRGLGQRVNAGDVIGNMGTTGYSTGVHLHFEVRTSSGGVTNPMNYLGSMFVWPTLSRRITQEYGMTDYAKAGAYGGAPHSGIDIGAVSPGVAGDPIFAAGPGEILFRDWRGAYGNAAIIGHDNGMMTLYAHMTN